MKDNMIKVGYNADESTNQTTFSNVTQPKLSISQPLNVTMKVPHPLKAKPVKGTKILLVAVVVLVLLLLGGILSALIFFEFNADDTFQTVIDSTDITESELGESSYESSFDYSVTDKFNRPEDNRNISSHKGTKNVVYPVRLVSGSGNNWEGRVEINYNGVWGTVCDKNFGFSEALVVCQQLGYSAGALEVKLGSYYGSGSNIWLQMKSKGCFRNEAELADCKHKRFDVVGNKCRNNDRDVGVVCIQGGQALTLTGIRLASGYDANSGRVEVEYGGSYGTVCDDSWDNSDAKVACKQLGLPSEGAVAVTNALFGGGSGNIVLDQIKCKGIELNLGACSRNQFNDNDCDHSEDAGVFCKNEPFEVRLVGGSNNNEGRVEINIAGQWGSVCDDQWGDEDAGVVCRQLGYTGSGHQGFQKAAFGSGSGPIWMDEVDCSGSENALEGCDFNGWGDHDFNGWGDHDCDHSEDAGVRCSGPPLASPGPDNQKPSITCPANQPTSGTIQSYSALMTNYDFPDATATDLNDNGLATTPIISYSIATNPAQTSMKSSGTFGVGITSVTATATDASGNSQECFFTVTVAAKPIVPNDRWAELANECGTPNSAFNTKIVGGASVQDIRAWPWAAYMMYRGSFNCGAELITKNWALTAAHCVDDVRFNLVELQFGKLDMTEPSTSNQHISGVGKNGGFVHPFYDSYTNDNDIALLKLTNPITSVTDNIRPVCFTQTSMNEYWYAPGGTCHVIGWGDLTDGGPSPEVLHEVQSSLITDATCRASYPNQITSNMICSSTSSYTGTCQGDSGGPMMCKNPSNGKWDLVGVTSWGTGCASPPYHDVMARVSQYTTWIESTINANGGP